ncbi:MAG: hypothetical protein JSU73_03965 [candidate division WOR-3 bacterium]|nr:MAG: hypothetical protein JSU73_03965 [candidate division WOR-3 bacterium]
MRARILVILGIAVAVLALYTIFRAQPESRLAATGSATAGQLQLAVATEVTGESEAAAGEATPPEGASPSETAESGAVGAEAETPAKQPETWGGDPFVRDWVMTSELAEMSLSAITIGGDKAYALINNQILEVGDQISGKRIIEIQDEQVVLEQGGRTFTLLLGE